MQIIISVAMSLDGYIDDCNDARLKLSSAQDFYQVHALRAICDAVFVGAGTVRADNPSLITKWPDLIEERNKRGMHPHPIKVTLTRSGEFDFNGNFFTKGEGEKYIFHCPNPALEKEKKNILSNNRHLKFFPVRGGGNEIEDMLNILREQKIKKLLIEGGCEILTHILRGGLGHQLRLAIAPIFVGDDKAPRLVRAADFSKFLRATPFKTEILGDTCVLWYELNGHK